MLSVQNLKKEYAHLLFENVSFMLGNNEKVGLVGHNGCGKTTLFRIIAGEEKFDEGEVQLVDETIGYLPQEFSFPHDLLVGEYLEELVEDHYTEFYKVEQVLAKLGIQDIDHYQALQTLSEGQKMKLYLASLITEQSNNPRQKPPILLLDEPTNHLDLPGILWMEGFLADYEGICIMISHDRDFLNNTVDLIFEIDEKGLLIFDGNYDDYIEGKKQWLEDREKRLTLQEKKREKLEQLIENARKLGDGKRRSRAVRSAKKRLEREVLRDEISEYKEMCISELDISGSVHRGKKMITVEGLSFSYQKNSEDENIILNNTNFEMRGSQKCWLLGANGSGKTTFIKLLTDQLQPQQGEIEWGANVNYAYFSQDQSHLDMEQTVADFFMEEAGVSFSESFGALKNFMFDRDMRDYKLKHLSPGQRARLSFAVFTYKSYDFLILDEPTNHLDISTKEVIEESLKHFKGGILLISHDRFFVKNLNMDKVVTISDNNIVDIAGDEVF